MKDEDSDELLTNHRAEPAAGGGVAARHHSGEHRAMQNLRLIVKNRSCWTKMINDQCHMIYDQ